MNNSYKRKTKPLYRRFGSKITGGMIKILLLLLVLLSPFGMKADWKNFNSNGFHILEKTEISPDRPYLLLKWCVAQESGKWDYLRNYKMEVTASDGTVHTIMTGDKYGFSYYKNLGVFVKDREHQFDGDNVKWYHYKWYPTQTLLTSGIKNIKISGIWTYSGEPNGNDKADVSRSLNMSVPSIKMPVGTFKRTAPGIITHSVSGIPNYKGDNTRGNFYDYCFTNSYSSFDWSRPYTETAVTSFNYNLNRTFNDTSEQKIFVLGISSENIKNASNVYSRFEQQLGSVTIKGCSYPTSLSSKTNLWEKKIELSWIAQSQNKDTNGTWSIFRYKKSGGNSTRVLIKSGIPYSTKNYIDNDSNLEYDTDYVYEICFVLSGWSDITTPIANLTTTHTTSIVRNTQIKLSVEGTSSAIILTMEHGTIGIECDFDIYRKDNKNQTYSLIKTLKRSSASTYQHIYTDENNLQSCTEYTYQIKSNILNKEVLSNEETISLKGNTSISYFKTSKGSFNNSVKLNWEVNQIGTNNTYYSLSRKIAGKDASEFKEIYTVSGTSDNYFYEDNLATPGQYYEYQISAYSDCGSGKVLSNSKTDIGFSQNSGIVSGRIYYGTGVSVQDAKVNLIKSDNTDDSEQFRSLRVDNLGGGAFWDIDSKTGEKLFVGKPFTLQMWVNLDANIKQEGSTAQSSPMIFDVFNGFSILFNNYNASTKKYRVAFTMPKDTLGGIKTTTTEMYVDAGSFFNIVYSTDGNGNYNFYIIYPDGSVDERKYEASKLGKWENKGVSFGTNLSRDNRYNFKGNIDDVRFYTVCRSKDEILKDYDRILSGEEKNLVGYWKFDEPVESAVFDISKTDGVANENHLRVTAGAVRSKNVPSADQLSLYGMTDVNGNYTIRGVPYIGNGTTYSIVPALGVHSFTPTASSRYVGNNSLVHSGVEFIDNSSFKVEGVVYYENTTYPVEGANLYVDGEICSYEGEMITTDSEGRFTISVPIGDHHISIKKNGHTFVNEGRYPADPQNVGKKLTFIKPISNLTFYDNTKLVFAGRVVGGEVESGKELGFGLSNANIGQAEIVLKTGYKMNVTADNSSETSIGYINSLTELNYDIPSDVHYNINCSAKVGAKDDESVRTITIKTDPATGEFAALIPPVYYEVIRHNIPSNSEIKIDRNVSTINMNPLVNYTDSIEQKDGTFKYFKYDNSLILEYRETPKMIVSDKGNDLGAFGDKDFVYKDIYGNDTISLYEANENGTLTYNFGSPIFRQCNTYEFKIKAFEEYVNKDVSNKPVYDRVPLIGNIITIINQMSASQSVYVEGDNDGKFAGDLKENQLALDSLGEAVYKFMAGYPNIVAPYTRGLNITYDVNGSKLQWDGNTTFAAIVLGELPSGNNFVTSGPDKVQMVLRDPPGTNSYAFWEEGITFTTEESDAGSFMTNNELTTVTKFGFEQGFITGTPAVGTIIESSTKSDMEVGVNINVTHTSTDTWSTTVTTNKLISTSGEFDYVGAAGDVFIGTATNIIFGNARSLSITKDINGEFSIDRDDVITTGSEFGTSFLYTENHIESTLIPNMYKLRNALLTTVTADEYNGNYPKDDEEVIYITTLSADNNKFGTSNIDKDIWGNDANSNSSKLSGPSYMMILPKNRKKDIVYQDKVLWYNEQIALWEKTLADNEKAKVEAIENSSFWLDVNYSFDSGSSIESSTTNCTSKSTTVENTFETLAVLGIATDVDIAGTGVAISTKTTTGGGYTGTSGSGQEVCLTTGFALVEEGNSDALTVDVYRAPDNFGAIFRTRGGQTSCPFEDAVYTKYYRPGTEISAATMQIEIPRIYAVNAFATDIPSGKTANFELKLDNLSEIDADVWFELAMLDETNPNGAKITMDGAVLINNRIILVRAGETLTKSLQLTQTDLGVLDYEDIKIVLKSQCQGDPTGIHSVVADTVTISANFVPSCSDVTIQIDDRIMNTYTSDQLQIVVKDYEMAYRNFKGIRIQYMGERDAEWKTAREYVISASDKNHDNELLESSRINFTMDMSNNALYPDQTYRFRAITMCDFGVETINNESAIIEIIKDMSKPTVIGKPSPANGVLTDDNDISLTFNENIKYSLLTAVDNFSVVGKLNGYTVDHQTALKLQGDAAYTEADIDLSGKSFSMDMWIKLTSAGTIVSHGNGINKFIASVNNSGILEIEIEGNKYTSTNAIPMNKWVFLTFAYQNNNNQGIFSSFVAYESKEETLFNSQSVALYSGSGRVKVGDKLQGAIHELTLWNKYRSLAESTSMMYIAKKANTTNLIGYWRMDEGSGNMIKDLARSRNMKIASSNSWYIESENYAAQFTGEDYVAINIRTSAIKADEDYALEMWFKASPKNEKSTLFSINETDLSLSFNNNGQIELTSKGALYTTNSTNYTDNNWHHMAINVTRNGTAILYVDGVNIKQLSADLFGQVSSDRLVLGARRYKNDKTGDFVYADRLVGAIDDVRLWKARMSDAVISENRYNRMSGDEAGLIAYYPFEKKTLDEGNQVITVSTFEDRCSAKVGEADRTSTTSITTSSPSLKESISLTNVNFTFVASENKIVINVNESDDIIEDCTLYFTIKDVRDLNNNLSLPVSWSAYISRNKLKWNEESISTRAESLAGATFSVAISNTSGDTESWTISNLPSWLSVDEEAGTLRPLSEKTLKFNVNSYAPIGKYEETIYLTGNKNISEPLLISLVVTGVKPEWEVNHSLYESSMNMIGQLKVVDIVSQDEEDLVGAFVDDVCVGLASPKYYDRYDSYYTLIDIYGNSNSAEKDVVFKVWDASTGDIYPVVTTSQKVTYADNQVLGSFADPMIINAKDMIEQRVALNKGWNWTSIFVNNPDDMSVNYIFSNIVSTAEIVKGKSLFAVPSSGKWTGSLETVSTGNMYKVKATAACDIKAIGKSVVPSKTPVTIKKGWNWIGFNPSSSMSLNDALASLEPTTGDIIKGHTGFAAYDGYEWVGSLGVMAPGKGYLYSSNSTSDKTLIYPDNNRKGSKSRFISSKIFTDLNPEAFDVVSENKYPGNMTIIARVIDGNDIIKDVEVGVFSKDECRGAIKSNPDGLLFLSVAGDQKGDNLSFRIMHNDVIKEIEQNISYSEDAMLGSIDSPYVITLSPTELDQNNAGISVYPTRTDDFVTVRINGVNINSIDIVDISGVNLFTAINPVTDVVLDMRAYESGIYFVRISRAEGDNMIVKVVKE